MPYINVGARIDGERPASKKELRDALADRPAAVTFDRTSDFGAVTSGAAIFRGDELVGQLGAARLSVTGPDPYDSRRWYATVELRNSRDAGLHVRFS